MNNTSTRKIDWDVVKQRMRASEVALKQLSTGGGQRLDDVFRQRAELLATRSTRGATRTKTTATLTFTMGNETYGVRLQDVAQVFADSELTLVRGTAVELAGIANLRGEVRSILDLRLLLGLSNGDSDTRRYILLLRHNGRQLGLRVEHIENVRQIDFTSLNPVNDGAAQSVCYVRGLTRDKLILLHTEEIFDRFYLR